ncbi:bifunctional adenosylcobinamide kinase/adenosylcobinamide-phosphate guanylyltransferase [Sulfitobacter sp. F26169L]|uniref:bifunctional adenosylcobinamide kinase/adenosylcobinamide-phosphate guanylyltransferase n=1 Tax=Sulfitobacter sp. F26169L TaxID=2996015 RepID=UPI002260D7AE|nr:bifunctional adenosylcobinamide kinase/adenosylcobinamide-phosphate guanylyltransferase [Sulfitobacter sp. F26169L]MCX7567797.1 bifunctional adenosylcobinamide kinase/adenosylcobinamide-phosphate guanylyltransferase [Sulfitobacter sp. F26169L]
MLPKGTFILGGAASGKSEWAESYILSSMLPPVYLATGRIGDDETKQRVTLHQNRRDARWTTIEEPLDLTAPLAELSPDRPVLIDCATMWLSNQMMQNADLGKATAALLYALHNCAAPWVIVSNEVGHGIVPDNKLARRFREAQGRLNIALARDADLAVMVIAGLPQVLKGRLP